MSKLAKRPGRPSQLTPELRVEIISEFGRTISVTEVAAAVGVPHQTLYRWLKRGEEGDDLYRELYLARERTRALGIDEALSVVRSVMTEGGQPALNAAKKWLAWFGGAEFHEKPKEQNITVTAKVDEDRARADRMLSLMTPEQLRQLEAGEDDEDIIDVEVVDEAIED